MGPCSVRIPRFQSKPMVGPQHGRDSKDSTSGRSTTGNPKEADGHKSDFLRPEDCVCLNQTNVWRGFGERERGGLARQSSGAAYVILSKAVSAVDARGSSARAHTIVIQSRAT